jgi:hypothetical protein
MASEDTPKKTKTMDLFVLMDRARQYSPVILPMIAVFAMRWILAPSTSTTIIFQDHCPSH